MAKQFLVRISPGSKRELHNHNGLAFHKKKGWYGPFDDEELAKALAKVPENDLNPSSSAPVFEVKECDEAKRVEEEEKLIEEPRGTPEKPRQMPGGKGSAPPAVTAEEPAEKKSQTKPKGEKKPRAEDTKPSA